MQLILQNNLASILLYWQQWKTIGENFIL